MGRHKRRPSRPPAHLWLIGAAAALLIAGMSVTGAALNGGVSTDTAPDSVTAAPEREQPSTRPESSATAGTPGGLSGSTTADPAPAPAPGPASPEPAPDEAAPPAPEPDAAPTPPPAPAPVPEPAAAPAPAPASGATAVEAEVLAIVNQERAAAGCGPVADDAGLRSVARAHSADMATRGFFSHTNPDGQSPWDRAGAAGISHAGGENIARGQADAASVMNAWMTSPGHRANILNCEFTTLGVGVHEGTGGPWWTQLFGY